MTRFSADQPPRVAISRTLSENPKRLARLRTTLAHELGHVLLHDVLRKYPMESAANEPAAVTIQLRRVRPVSVSETRELTGVSGRLATPVAHC